MHRRVIPARSESEKPLFDLFEMRGVTNQEVRATQFDLLNYLRNRRERGNEVQRVESEERLQRIRRCINVHLPVPGTIGESHLIEPQPREHVDDHRAVIVGNIENLSARAAAAGNSQIGKLEILGENAFREIRNHLILVTVGMR
jgi:hypothetical protein